MSSVEGRGCRAVSAVSAVSTVSIDWGVGPQDLCPGTVSWDRWTCVLGPLDLCPGTAGPVPWDRCERKITFGGVSGVSAVSDVSEFDTIDTR